MRGSKTVTSKEVEFRAHYLGTGNASAAARVAGLPISTGMDLAKRANADKQFVKARQEMYARALPDGGRMLFAGVQIALERLGIDPVAVAKKLAPKPQARGKANARITVQDSGAQYLRSMAAAVDVIAKIRKLDAELQGDIAPSAEVRIIVTTTEADGQAEQGD